MVGTASGTLPVGWVWGRSYERRVPAENRLVGVTSFVGGVWFGVRLHPLQNVADYSRSFCTSFSFQCSREFPPQHQRERRPPTYREDVTYLMCTCKGGGGGKKDN